MIISTCGYGTTGASAVIDFLKGYPDKQVYDGAEFQLLHQPDGICDLKYHLCISKERIGSNAAIKRFIKIKYTTIGRLLQKQCSDFYPLMDKYIERLTVSTWNGRSGADPSDVTNLSTNKYYRYFQRGMDYFLRKRNKNGHFPRYQKRYYSTLSKDYFDSVTKDFLHQLFRSLNLNEEKDIIFDMLLSSTNPELGMEFFDDCKVIIVDRDPRDLFLATQRNIWANAYIPWDSVEKFVDYYKTLRINTNPYKDALHVQYENLIYHYYETTQMIMSFLGYNERPQNEFTFFDPDFSVRYTNRKTDQTEFAAQIKYIEDNLPEYLYDFPKYIPVKEQLLAFKQ
jgi:hypothetical protein